MKKSKNNLSTNKRLVMTLSLLCILILSSCGLNQKQKNAQSSVESESIENQNIVMFGDSITQKNRDIGKSYTDTVAKKTGLKVTNIGFGGTAMSIHPQEDFGMFSFYALADAIVNEDYSKQEKALENKEIPKDFADTLTVLKEIDWNKVEYISVLYGANDWGKPIENEQDPLDVNTFKGAGRHGLDELLEVYPHLKIVFIPAPYRFWPDYNNVDSDTSVNALGLKPSQYSDAMMDLAKEYESPYADTFYGLGINKDNRELYFDGVDGTHPNNKGLVLIGNSVAETLLNDY
ncbi:SGNH/GDSL hydrolase family protein [Carnobacterium sp.]|uniref:SGNH/GDSL hydrolase family protein n=1 Tax=Carnobacterium sp. TaxID=48221 RepID=UPI002648F701|nr:SGNH/GDSL hydrolase family protein [Carnobacterium sp.]